MEIFLLGVILTSILSGTWIFIMDNAILFSKIFRCITRDKNFIFLIGGVIWFFQYYPLFVFQSPITQEV